MFWTKWFTKPVKKIAFLDGDQPLPRTIAAYHRYLVGTETHLVRYLPVGHSAPQSLRDPKLDAINKIYLEGYTAGKEIVDKFIGSYIQKSIDDGYKHITVVSSDYDFIDIFKLAMMLNPAAGDVTFRMIVPNAQGRMIDATSELNIEIVKV